MRSAYWRDVIWQASGNTLAQAVGILGIPVMTRLYTPQEFAVQALFIQLMTLGTALVTWRYEYFVQLPRARGDARALNQLVLILGMVAIAVLSPVLWNYRESLAAQMGNRALAPWLPFVPVTCALVSWAVASQNNAQRFGDFKTSGFSELVGKLCYVGVGIAGGIAHLGACALIATTALGATGKTLFIFLSRPSWGKYLWHAQASRVRQVLSRYHRLASSTVLAHLLSTAAIMAPQVTLAHLYGADVLGQFALVLTTIYLPSSLLGSAIGHVYYQRAALIYSQGESFFGLWRGTAAKLALIGAPVFGLVALVSPWAYPLVFGPQWTLAGTLATWMSLAAFGSFISGPMDRTCLIVGAGLYAILWSLFRLLSTLLVVWLATRLPLEPNEFIAILVTQMCLAYGIDFWAGARFSQGRLGIFTSKAKEQS